MEVSSATADAAQAAADANASNTANSTSTTTPGSVADAAPKQNVDALVEERIKKEIAARQDAKNKWKSEKARADELQAKLDEAAKQEAEKQGKYKELWEKREAQYKELHDSWLKDKVQLSVTKALTDSGCVDAELALAAGKSDLLEFDANTGNVDGVDAWLQDLKDRKPLLFNKQLKASVNPSLPGGVGDLTPKKQDYSKLTADQIKAEIAKLAKERAKGG